MGNHTPEQLKLEKERSKVRWKTKKDEIRKGFEKFDYLYTLDQAKAKNKNKKIVMWYHMKLIVIAIMLELNA